MSLPSAVEPRHGPAAALPGPLERAAQLRRLRLYLPALADRLGDVRWLEHELRNLERQQQTPVEFALIDGGRFAVGGDQVLPRCGAGLGLAWLALAAAEHRIEPLRVEHLSTARRPGVTVLAALRRAADRVERNSPTLSSAIRALGVERGRLVPKATVAQVRCVSPTLVRIFASTAAAP